MDKEIKPTDFDVIAAAMREIEKAKYKPTYIKYHNGKEWVDIKLEQDGRKK